MSRIHVIATGGTIAMAHDTDAGGAVLSLSGSDFVGRMLGQAASGIPDVTHEEYGPVPSSHFTVEHLWGLRERVVAAVDEPDVAGVVITHGTDSLEETAYLVDLTVPSDKPVCVTGAMRIASQPGYEGIANLIASVRTASSDAARGLGAVVVLNDEIHAARDVTKMHTQSLDTFRSPSYGPIGRVEAEGVVISRRVERDVIPCGRLERSVYLFKLAVGMDARLLEQAVALRARGAVVETFGGGRVPPWWLHAMQAAIDAGVVVAATTRCPTGRLYDPYRYEGAYQDLQAAGCLLAHELNGQKCRLRLMAALGLARDPRELIEVWNGRIA
jgi:L-asparaginase